MKQPLVNIPIEKKRVFVEIQVVANGYYFGTEDIDLAKDVTGNELHFCPKPDLFEAQGANTENVTVGCKKIGYVIAKPNELICFSDVTMLPDGDVLLHAIDYAVASTNPMFDTSRDNLVSRARHWEECGFSEEVRAKLSEQLQIQQAIDSAAEMEANRLNHFLRPCPQTMESLQGGFSEKVFRDIALRKYLRSFAKDGIITSAFGYLGSCWRKAYRDGVIETFLRDELNLTPHQIALWVISDDGGNFVKVFDDDAATLIEWEFGVYKGTRDKTPQYCKAAGEYSALYSKYQHIIATTRPRVDTERLRQVEGFVHVKPNLPVDQWQGGLSQEVWEAARKMAPAGCRATYLKNFDRKVYQDRVIEFVLATGYGLSPTQIATYLSRPESYRIPKYVYDHFTCCVYPYEPEQVLGIKGK